MGWEKVKTTVDGQQKEYWWNTETDETSWTTPEGVTEDSHNADEEVVSITGPASQAGAAPQQQHMLTEEYGVYFRLRTGVKILVENCRADMTIWAFKQEIEKYEQGLPANESRLSYGGNPIVDTNTLGYYGIGPNTVVHLHEKTLEQIEYDEVRGNKVSAEMGVIKVAAGGMRGFAGCLVFAFVCLAVGIPILVVATFVDQWTPYQCVRGAAIEGTPCSGTGEEYSCPVEVDPVCSSDYPSSCVTSFNTSALAVEVQRQWYRAADTDALSVYCCSDEFWCSVPYQTSLTDDSALMFGVLTAEDHQLGIYCAWGVIGLGLLSFLIAIAFLIAAAVTKKYGRGKKLHVINNRQSSLVVGN